MMCYCDRLSTGMSEEEHSILRACLYVNPDHLTEQVSSNNDCCHGDTHIHTGMGGDNNINCDVHVNDMS